MGHGISQICAQARWDVVVREIDQAPLDKGMGKISKQLSRAVERGQDGAIRCGRRARPDHAHARLQRPRRVGSVIEAITEDLDQKLEMWKEVDGQVKDDAYLATNTSSLSVATRADATKRPERMIGLHFFNPRVMPLIEVVRAEKSSLMPSALGFESARSWARRRSRPATAARFIVNRLLVPYAARRDRAHEQGVGRSRTSTPG